MNFKDHKGEQQDHTRGDYEPLENISNKILNLLQNKINSFIHIIDKKRKLVNINPQT